jgi:hypothetical protein
LAGLGLDRLAAYRSSLDARPTTAVPSARSGGTMRTASTTRARRIRREMIRPGPARRPEPSIYVG